MNSQGFWTIAKTCLRPDSELLKELKGLIKILEQNSEEVIKWSKGNLMLINTERF